MESESLKTDTLKALVRNILLNNHRIINKHMANGLIIGQDIEPTRECYLAVLDGLSLIMELYEIE